MRRLCFVFLLVVTLYASAMYQYPPLLLLFLIELFLSVLLSFLAVYFKRHLSLDKEVQQGMIEKGAVYQYKNRIRNRGRLPVGRLRLKVYGCYWQRPTIGKGVSLDGSSDCGDGEIQFHVEAPYCGLLRLRLDKLIVYDYLSLFSCSKSVDQELILAVLPKKKRLQIHIVHQEMVEAYQRQETVERPSWSPENSYGEIRQIREYHEGDSLRHIHWNQSARTDRLWVREYEEEQATERQAELLLEPKPSSKWISGKEFLEGLDAFYELALALMLGLLQEYDRLQVYWYAERGESLTGMEAVTEEDCQEILLRLYSICFQMEKEEEEKRTGQLLERYRMRHGMFRLTSELCWYYETTLIHPFSRNRLEEEINGQTFEL